MQVEPKDKNQMNVLKYVSSKIRLKNIVSSLKIKTIKDDGKDGVKGQLAKMYCV